MDTRESSRQVKVLEERYHEIHRYARLIRARLATLGTQDEGNREEVYRGQEELAGAERDKRAILVAIEEIEDQLVE